ncbi:hypothetical protein CsSME_00030589 [Camellia sinensis var. sinensis]
MISNLLSLSLINLISISLPPLSPSFPVRSPFTFQGCSSQSSTSFAHLPPQPPSLSATLFLNLSSLCFRVCLVKDEDSGNWGRIFVARTEYRPLKRHPILVGFNKFTVEFESHFLKPELVESGGGLALKSSRLDL